MSGGPVQRAATRLYRPGTVAAGIAFVLLGGLARLAEPGAVFDDPARVTTSGGVGESLRYGDSQVTVTRTAFARTFVRDRADSKPVGTRGVYVVVEYDAVRGAADPGVTTATLGTDDGVVYRPVSEVIATGIEFPQAGFARSAALVFEADPENLAGLRLLVRPSIQFTVLSQELSIDLGVPDEQVAERSVERAGDQYVLPASVTRVAG